MEIIPRIESATNRQCQEFESKFNRMMLEERPRRRCRKNRRRRSFVMTIIVGLHHSGYRTLSAEASESRLIGGKLFRHYYTKHICVYLRWIFPLMVSHNRFVELIAESLLPLCVHLQPRNGRCMDVPTSTCCRNRSLALRCGADAAFSSTQFPPEPVCILLSPDINESASAR